MWRCRCHWDGTAHRALIFQVLLSQARTCPLLCVRALFRWTPAEWSFPLPQIPLGNAWRPPAVRSRATCHAQTILHLFVAMSMFFKLSSNGSLTVSVVTERLSRRSPLRRSVRHHQHIFLCLQWHRFAFVYYCFNMMLLKMQTGFSRLGEIRDAAELKPFSHCDVHSGGVVHIQCRLFLRWHSIPASLELLHYFRNDF